MCWCLSFQNWNVLICWSFICFAEDKDATRNGVWKNKLLNWVILIFILFQDSIGKIYLVILRNINKKYFGAKTILEISLKLFCLLLYLIFRKIRWKSINFHTVSLSLIIQIVINKVRIIHGLLAKNWRISVTLKPFFKHARIWKSDFLQHLW